MGATILAVLIICLWGYTAYRTFPIASSASQLLSREVSYIYLFVLVCRGRVDGR